MRLKLEQARRQLYLSHLQYFGRYCFIHINKCGGTTIEHAMRIPKIHDTADDRIKKIGIQAWKRMTTFTIVRHPYTRVVSHFLYRKQKGKTKYASRELTLNEWIYIAHHEQDRQLCDIPLMFRPCSYWVCDETGSILVDRVLHLESLEHDWEAFRKGTALPTLPAKKNVTRGITLESALKLLEPKSIDIINRNFAQDFNIFYYERKV